MTTEQYEQLLNEVSQAKDRLVVAIWQAEQERQELYRLQHKLDHEESRIAHEALGNYHSASRKLVVGE